MSLQSTIYYLREYFFPTGCAVCGKALSHADARYGLCEKCRAAFGIALVAGRRCRCCGKPLITERETCLACRVRIAGGKEAAAINRDGACSVERYGEHVTRLRLLFPYVGKFRTALVSFKFKKATALGIFFARCLSLSLEAFGPQALENAVWVPVPPRPGKLRQQGWDQVEFLAKQLGKAGRKVGKAASKAVRLVRPPARRCLKRLPSKSQKLLNAEERLQNLKGRIRCVRKPPQTAILFDDVMTTGATIDACAEALIKAGAKRVYAVCLYYR
jgi:ComF family protein